jgi:hypothetical protein
MATKKSDVGGRLGKILKENSDAGIRTDDKKSTSSGTKTGPKTGKKSKTNAAKKSEA